MSILDHVVVPVASDQDVEMTCAALEPHLDEIERVTAVHVIEKAGGAVDKAPIGKRREDAAEYLATVEARLGGSVAIDTQTTFGTDIVETIFRVSADVGATAVVFTPRGGSRVVRLLTGDTATRLVTDPDLPVVSLPVPEE